MTDVVKIGIEEVLPSDDEIGIQSGRRAKFFDRPVPVPLQGIGPS